MPIFNPPPDESPPATGGGSGIENPLIENLAAGGHKITGLASGSANGDALRYEQLVGAYLPLDWSGGPVVTGGDLDLRSPIYDSSYFCCSDYRDAGGGVPILSYSSANGWRVEAALDINGQSLIGLPGIPTVIDFTHSAPPAAHNKGDAYLVKATGSGAWAGKSNYIATWGGAAWAFTAPVVNGGAVYDRGTGRLWVYDGSGSGWTDPVHANCYGNAFTATTAASATTADSVPLVGTPPADGDYSFPNGSQTLVIHVVSGVATFEIQ